METSAERRQGVLEARDVVKRYDGVTALDGVSLHVARGECVALVGESGSGKTTLLRTFNRMVDPDQGDVLVRGESVARRDPVELRRTLGYVPQEGGLLPHWSVARNAAMVPRLLGLDAPRQRGLHALERVGLDPVRFGPRWPRSLSGGQRQRAALARALAAEPDVVLLDEPFGALDAITRSELQAAFAELLEGGGFTALLVTHDLREAALLARRVAVLKSGRVVQVGAPDELRDAPRETYVATLLQRAGLA